MMIRVKNEAEWIQASLLSLNGFADEAIIIENYSDDDSYEKIKEIIPKLKYKVILRKEKSTEFDYVSNLALSLTSYSWIFRWDGDFIGHTSGDNGLKNLRNYILALPSTNFYVIYPLLVNFYGDLFHVMKDKPLHSEGYIHSYHKRLEYFKKHNSIEVLKVPFFFKIINYQKIVMFHAGTAKTLQRMIYRSLWSEWLNNIKRYDHPTFKSYLSYKFSNNKDLSRKYIIDEMEEKIKKTVKYSVEKFGDYPELMKPFLEKPTLKIIYKDVKPWSRNDFKNEI
ncbi:MAG: hypothetical protein K8S23_12145 [Candidatus Cloacimonetes bacterium]|nr:hypothetical protein [Candidatus Cloacimonadota bacterium]